MNSPDNSVSPPARHFGTAIDTPDKHGRQLKAKALAIAKNTFTKGVNLAFHGQHHRVMESASQLSHFDFQLLKSLNQLWFPNGFFVSVAQLSQIAFAPAVNLVVL